MIGNKNGCRIILIGCACAMLAAGCKTRRPPSLTGTGDDTIRPEPLDGDYALSERSEMGRPVTDVEFRRVQFRLNSFQIDDSEVPKIADVAEYMASHRDVRLVSEGHTCERGSREYNVSLGEYRALAVRAHIIGLGIDPSRIQTISYGEERPVDAGHTEACRARNRRVEFALFR
jgi:peptidoglycan-associated lipoprotein